MAEIRIGTSGWRYPPWRGQFYPKGLPQRRELEYLSRQFNSTELNGSFYSLQRPERYRGWAEETPEDFVFAVKGGRFITHLKRLREVRTPLANFFASGVLSLRGKLGPILWQLPPRLEFDPRRLADFFDQLPRDTRAAAKLAREHDAKLKGEPDTEPGGDRPIRHALEVRHPSFATAECVNLLREHEIGLVVADSAQKFPQLEDVTADFVYVRLHGSEEIYVSGYRDSELDDWARKVRAWREGRNPRSPCRVAKPAARIPRDVYVYFDNDVKVRAPADAHTLADKLSLADKLNVKLDPRP